MNDSATFIQAQATVAQTKAAPNIGRVKGMDEAHGGGVDHSMGADQSDVSNLISLFDAVVDILDSAITTIRTNAATLGSNVSLLQTRLDFMTSYVNTLTGGSDKLTLADLNEEGANLVALQTRQQHATQTLAFAGQAERAVLQLFT